MRDDFSCFFGATKFNLNVYEKIAVITIPVGKDFFALLSLENKMNNKDASEAEKEADNDFYFPKSLKKISSFIKEKERDIKYITTDL